MVSELPDEWELQVQTWSQLLRAHRGDAKSATTAPDRNDEYLFFQLLLGSWPAELLGSGVPDQHALAPYAKRVKEALTKSMREAKVHSTWGAPGLAYEDAVLSFADLALDPERSGDFLAAFLPFVERIAAFGAQNSLVQTVLKLTLPGMPDIYQGTELWDLSLVDPDNRRPVDYGLRSQLLQEVESTLANERATAIWGFLRNWRDGRFKLAATLLLLKFRHEQLLLFTEGGYEALPARGDGAAEVCAYIRRHENAAMLVAVARFPTRRDGLGSGPKATIPVSEPLRGGTWSDLLTGRTFEMGAGLDAAVMFEELPVAVLVQKPS